VGSIDDFAQRTRLGGFTLVPVSGYNTRRYSQCHRSTIFLALLSVVELPSCWTQRPSLFISPTLETDPQKRALRVLQWILCSLISQFYVGQDVNAGMRKPLNAFLGELFFGQWNDERSTARMISEQVRYWEEIIFVNRSMSCARN
jgi:hypothetical protein